MQSQTEDPLLRIQREITEVTQRENELRNGYHQFTNGQTSPTPNLQNNNNNNKILKKQASEILNIDTSPTLQPSSNALQRALSTSTLSLNSSQAVPKRFAPNPDQRGLMQRFIKSRGKLSLSTIAPVKDPASISWTRHSDFSDAPRSPVKLVRKGYVPVEERIQQELREMQNRENELRIYRRKTLAASQPDLLAIIDPIDDSPLSSPPSTPKLKSARSFAHLCDDSDSFPNDTVSAPSSLRPAVSLAKLCDDNLDESDVPSSSQLIAKFESIIQKNRTNGVVNHL